MVYDAWCIKISRRWFCFSEKFLLSLAKLYSNWPIIYLASFSFFLFCLEKIIRPLEVVSLLCSEH